MRGRRRGGWGREPKREALSGDLSRQLATFSRPITHRLSGGGTLGPGIIWALHIETMPKKAKSRVSVGLGFRVHSGWATVVAVTGPASSPTVVDRRRIELAESAIRGSLQPFHAVAELPLVAAEEFIKRRADSTNALALQSLRRLINGLSQPGYQAIGSCILVGSGRPLGTLESILASHAMIHTAEGEFFREAIRRANEACGLPVTGIKEREILSRGAAELGLPLERIHRRLLELGRAIGPPWRQDEKLATLAGWLILARA